MRRSLRPIPVLLTRPVPLAVTLLAACLLSAPAAHAQVAAGTATDAAAAEERTARYFDSIRHDPNVTLMFLREMPKGGDLHSHLTGAIYAETYIEWAVQDGVCVDLATGGVVVPPCDDTSRPPAARALQDTELYGRIIDAMSVRNWHAARMNGHDRFFETFGRFVAVSRAARTGDMLAEVTSRAALGHVIYLELMHTPDGPASGNLGRQVGWSGDVAATRQRLLDAGLRAIVHDASAVLDAADARRNELQQCSTPQRDAGCDVVARYLYQVLRARAPEQVFAQIVMGFELAAADPRVVGLNLVQPEDAYLAMRDYSLHMQMIGALRRFYPDVPVTLHAGELASGLVPPEGLRFHIAEAVRVAGARRIGHGVDIAHEDGAAELLQQMARDSVLVEIALTSNDVILGVRGRDHPLALYMAHGVPVALATDDEGVARSEMTMEWLKAVREQDVGYIALKTMARNSIRFSFADVATKARLVQQLEDAFRAFEARAGALSDLHR
jgi:adenosine deaminase